MNEKEWGKSCIHDVESQISELRLIRDTQSMRDGYLIDQQMDRQNDAASNNGYAIPARRILIFQSTDAQVIKVLLMRAPRLRRLIAQLPSFGCYAEEEGNGPWKWKIRTGKQKEMRQALSKTDQDELYNFFYMPKTPYIRLLRNFMDVFKAEDCADPQMSVYYRCTPCYQLLNFQDIEPRKQKEMLRMFLENDCFRDSVLLISSLVQPDLAGYGDAAEVIEVALPRIEDIMCCLRESVQRRRRNAGASKPLPADFESVLRHEAGSLLGMRFGQIDDVIDEMKMETGFCCEAEAGSILARQRCRKSRTAKIKKLRKEMSKAEAMMSVSDCSDSNIASPPGYGQWLDNQIQSYQDESYAIMSGQGYVKGVLMAGPPGTGKTVMARYTAAQLGVPLVQMEMQKIKTMWQGESQKQLEAFLRQVNQLQPCVLFIDEIDKVFQQNSSDNKTDTEMRGQMLQWMQSHTGAVFCFFTANYVKDLPRELIRNDRLSARMFAFMPSAQELANILRMQLKEISDSSYQKQKEEGLDPQEVFLSEDFRRMLAGEEAHQMLTTLIDSIRPENGDTISDWKDKPLFFTGADMKELLKTVAQHLNQSISFRQKTGRSGNRRAYTYEEFKEMFLKCARKASTQCTGGFDDVVRCWMMLREEGYIDVMQADEDMPMPPHCAQSVEPVLPMGQYNTSYSPNQKSGKPLFILEKNDWRAKAAPKAGEAHHYDYYMYHLVTSRVKEIVDAGL